MKSRGPTLLLPTVLVLALTAAKQAEAHHPHGGPRVGVNFYFGPAYAPRPCYPCCYGRPYPVYPAYPVAYPYPVAPVAVYPGPVYGAYSYPRYDAYGPYAW